MHFKLLLLYFKERTDISKMHFNFMETLLWSEDLIKPYFYNVCITGQVISCNSPL